MTRWAPLLGALLLGALGLTIGAPRAAAEPLDPAEARGGVGVASFERIASDASAPVSVAGLLAEKLSERGVPRVVGPRNLAVPADADPAPADVREWARVAGVDLIVVGSATQLGGRTSVDVRVRSGASGAVVATYVEEFARGDDLGAVADRLAERILDGPLEASAAVSSPPEPVPASAEGAGRLPLGVGVARDCPIKITADETEFLLDEGRTVFTGRVRVVQCDVTLRCNRMDAAFKEGTQEPERIVCQGNVRVEQGDRRLKCQRGTYVSAEQRVICEGDATFWVGENRGSSEVIEFDLANNKVFFRRGAEIDFVGDESAD